jgi:hypothetical protein
MGVSVTQKTKELSQSEGEGGQRQLDALRDPQIKTRLMKKVATPFFLFLLS